MSKMIDAAVATKRTASSCRFPMRRAQKSIQGAIAAGIPVLGIDSWLTKFKDSGILGYLGRRYQAGVASAALQSRRRHPHHVHQHGGRTPTSGQIVQRRQGGSGVKERACR